LKESGKTRAGGKDHPGGLLVTGTASTLCGVGGRSGSTNIWTLGVMPGRSVQKGGGTVGTPSGVHAWELVPLSSQWEFERGKMVSASDSRTKSVCRGSHGRQGAGLY